ncbi:Ribonuclease P/MRP protein subunit POP5 [Psilocybe cubensis]|uniref:Ribonuclease P/MRP protein subunit POP5 n=1 Tax=Psilocybe cubensis TaxID=181762 RepID=A0ACB8H253_PSICU|nr:Ribonuclease P/MRP protein subunit POP5 [Psilocybe cubensis]KAH9481858.1 Ribonuclease P/MRP protein subunit POP5 [Psilocybe cubensis]
MVRFKNRWLLVEFIPVLQGHAQLGKSTFGNGSLLDGKAIWASLKQSVLTNFGDTGWGAVGLSLTVKYFSPTTNICIIRVARDQHNVAWGALTLLSIIDGVRYIPNVVHVSGTIKHAQLSAISHNREVIARYRALAKNSDYDDIYDTYLDNSEREIESLQD